ncbi:MAG: hypothetical protein K2N05_09500 [Muribaculaceae bacterium]|nr:hypothetical protein [Muribaculaceae bacterium]
MYALPKNDPDYSRWRLDHILSRRRLKFNPYTVADTRLMEIVGMTGWGNEWDITEMVTVVFTRLREVNDYRKFDGIYMTVGMDLEEIFIPVGSLIHAITACDTMQPERSRVGSKPIRNTDDIRKLVGNRYFVSRVIRGVNIRRNGKCAYRFHRLTGRLEKDAAMIRKAMCEAKIEMLERILKCPRASCHLDCSPGLFDYESRIRLVIDLIRRFPEAGVPEGGDQ